MLVVVIIAVGCAAGAEPMDKRNQSTQLMKHLMMMMWMLKRLVEDTKLISFKMHDEEGDDIAVGEEVTIVPDAKTVCNAVTGLKQELAVGVESADEMHHGKDVISCVIEAISSLSLWHVWMRVRDDL